jgi:hypothetical protein
MTNGVNNPLGLEPIGTFTGAAPNFALTQPYQTIASAYASSLFIGDPIAPQASGSVGIGLPGVPLPTSAPLVTQAATPCMGVFDGCIYTNTSNAINLGAGPTGVAYWQSGTVLAAGTTAIANIVGLDPNTLYSIQVNGTAGATATNTYNTANFAAGTGNLLTGLSAYVLDLSSIIALTQSPYLNLKVWGLNNNPSNAWGIPNNNVVVTINNHFLRLGVTGI